MREYIAAEAAPIDGIEDVGDGAVNAVLHSAGAAASAFEGLPASTGGDNGPATAAAATAATGAATSAATVDHDDDTRMAPPRTTTAQLSAPPADSNSGSSTSFSHGSGAGSATARARTRLVLTTAPGPLWLHWEDEPAMAQLRFQGFVGADLRKLM